MMNKIAKTILLGAGCYLAYFIFITVWCGHSMNFEVCKQYTWIFKDSVAGNLTGPGGYFWCVSDVKKRDVHNVFSYRNGNDLYQVIVWEFKDLVNANLNKISVSKNADIDSIRFLSGEILHSGSNLPINVNYGFSFYNSMGVNLDKSSKIDGVFNGSNYKGFYGTLNKMSFSNEKGKHQIVFDYTPKPNKTSFSYAIVLFYKGHQSFYVIIINSEKPFKDASIIDILNLQ